VSGLFSGIGAAVQLTRPLNLLLSVVGVGVGAALAIRSSPTATEAQASILIAMFSAAAIAAAANAVNDFYDVDIDRMNRPDRPIPSGRVSQPFARVVWVSCAAVGIGLSLLLTPLHTLIAALSAGIVFLYSYRLKRLGFVGNLVVAGMVTLTLVYGALTTGRIGFVWVGCIAAFLLTLAREITKDLEDLKGDRRNGVSSLPTKLGPKTSRWIVVFLVALTIALSPMPYTHLSFSGIYLFFVLIAAVVLLVPIWILVKDSPGIQEYTRTSQLLKTAMVIGMIGLLLA
jgi:geranylgeranylglycerol-phosphate geranylgeranyltransferase